MRAIHLSEGMIAREEFRSNPQIDPAASPACASDQSEDVAYGPSLQHAPSVDAGDPLAADVLDADRHREGDPGEGRELGGRVDPSTSAMGVGLGVAAEYRLVERFQQRRSAVARDPIDPR